MSTRNRTSMSQNTIHNASVISLACVRTGIGPFGTIPSVSRVSIVDSRGQIVFDSLIAPMSPTSDYNTQAMQLTAYEISEDVALSFEMAQECVRHLVNRKVIVGPRLVADLSVLGIQHPPSHIRDMSAYHNRYPVASTNSIAWSPVTNSTCSRCLNGQQHNIELARLAMDVYQSTSVHWDEVIRLDSVTPLMEIA